MTTQTVREIALERPSSIRVFEQFGIDYCCGGHKPLTEACSASNVAVDEVITALEQAATQPAKLAVDWTAKPAAELASHILNTHHAYVKRELPRLAALSAKTVNRHGDTRPELKAIQSKLALVGDDLIQHLAKEEVILFPYIFDLERAIAQGAPKPQGCFGTVASPILMMAQEHEAAGALLAEIRALSRNFTPPEDACPTYHAFYDGLREFEQDLHQHIHLENNILFPRAIELETRS